MEMGLQIKENVELTKNEQTKLGMAKITSGNNSRNIINKK
jgi:hypothetical protein